MISLPIPFVTAKQGLLLMNKQPYNVINSKASQKKAVALWKIQTTTALY